MWRALRVMLEKEFRQIWRDPLISRMLFVSPLLQLALLANAASFEVTQASLWVVDQDRTPTAAALVDRLTASGRFAVAGFSVTSEPGERALRDGSASAVLTIPPDFASELSRTRQSTVQLVLNAVNGSQAGVTQGYVAQIVARFAQEQGATMPLASGASAQRSPAVEIRSRGWFNSALDYRHYMVPGILVQLITMIGTLMTALNIVREKEAGTLEQLNVTPLSAGVFVAAKLIPLWVISLMVFTLGLLIALLGFGVPFVGSVVLLYCGAALFLVGALGVGLWISTITDTQQQALFVTFSVLMIYILMSGLFTPVRGMPDWVRSVAQVNPLLHFISLTRGVMLRGAGVGDVWRELLALAIIGPAVLAMAVRQSRKQLR